MTAAQPGSSAGRVLMVSRHSYPSHTVLRRNAEHLAGLGFRVDLVCSGVRSKATRDTTPPPPGLRVIRIPVRHRRGSALLYLFEYAAFGTMAIAVATAFTLRHSYLAVQVDNPPDLLVLAAVAGRLRRVRVVLNLLELSPELTAARLGVGPAHPLVRLNRVFERLAVSLSDHVLTVSQTCLRILSRRGLDPARATVVPNGCQVPPDSSARTVGDAPQLVTQASLIERYGVQIALRALAVLRQRWPDLTLRVIGDGDYRPELVRLAGELGLGDRVVFTGFLPWAEAMREVGASTIGLVPIIPDGYGELLLPTKLLEMVELDLPVVCARLPAIVESFGEDAFWYFPPGDPAGLAEAVDRLLRDAEGRRALARRARVAAHGLRWSAVADSYVGALVPGLAARVVPAVTNRP